MCNRCFGLHKEIEVQLPEDELWELFRAAHQQYQSQIIQGHKAYTRFVNDLISYHIYIQSSNEHIIRTHIQNVSTLHELLTTRMDLVEEFFNWSTFTMDDYALMLQRFNSTEPSSRSEVIAYFSDRQLQIITEFCNRHRFFTHTIEAKEIRDFFLCRLTKPLIAINSVPVIFLLNALHHAGLICQYWQDRIARHQMLAPQSTMKPFSSSALSSRLSEARHQLVSPLQEPYGELIKQLIEKM